MTQRQVQAALAAAKAIQDDVNTILASETAARSEVWSEFVEALRRSRPYWVAEIQQAEQKAFDDIADTGTALFARKTLHWNLRQLEEIDAILAVDADLIRLRGIEVLWQAHVAKEGQQ